MLITALMHPKILKPELNVMPKMGNWIISAVYEIQTHPTVTQTAMYTLLPISLLGMTRLKKKKKFYIAK